ncbi:peptidylprolyl isomerase [Plasmodiophora brassicae]|uniref:peptidylprolyl isomerase n=1 Tax=Plasmodiophora brassicae TaxID=37360 RepID=A0A0G4IM54_PLABS|nr:hypothetical protein PBRA_004934 [Plasmodiophora brassicae]SPQ99198.1 unnamed protein product [Plasmodiophora brassicae]
MIFCVRPRPSFFCWKQSSEPSDAAAARRESRSRGAMSARSCHPKAALNVFRGGKFYKQVAIGASDSMTFGRDEFKCDHVLVHPSASDIHAMFTHDEHGHLQLIDLGSEHGTSVGDERLPANSPRTLADGDVIKFGESTRKYVLSLEGNLPEKPGRPSDLARESSSNGNAKKRRREPDESPPEQIRASHILVKHVGSRNPSSWREKDITRSEDDALRAITSFRKAIVSGDRTFEDIARSESDCSSHSRSGDLGKFAKGKMQKAFEEVAFSLKISELSGPVFTNSGIHLIKRTG